MTLSFFKEVCSRNQTKKTKYFQSFNRQRVQGFWILHIRRWFRASFSVFLILPIKWQALQVLVDLHCSGCMLEQCRQRSTHTSTYVDFSLPANRYRAV